jgi:hypothetical protein
MRPKRPVVLHARDGDTFVVRGDTFVVRNDELSSPGNLVFDYVVETLAKQPEVAAAYRSFAAASDELIDDEQLSAFLDSNA